MVQEGGRRHLASPRGKPPGPGLLLGREIGWPLAPVPLDDAVMSVGLAAVCVFCGSNRGGRPRYEQAAGMSDGCWPGRASARVLRVADQFGEGNS